MLDRTLLALLMYVGSLAAGLTTFLTPDAREDRKQVSSTIETTNQLTKLTIRHIESLDKTSPKPLEKAELELMLQMQNPKVPPIAYWERVAECETHLDWDNKGQWAGGLGIFTRGKFRDSNMGTWERYGGEEFARHPSGATKTEQLVIANRIAVLGYSTLVIRDPEVAKVKGVPPTYVWEKEPVGFDGWGCIRNTVGSPAEWAKRQSD